MEGNPPSQGGPARTKYQKELTFVKAVMLLLVPGTSTADKEVSLARMYFKGELALLKDAFIAHVQRIRPARRQGESAVAGRCGRSSHRH